MQADPLCSVVAGLFFSLADRLFFFVNDLFLATFAATDDSVLGFGIPGNDLQAVIVDSFAFQFCCYFVFNGFTRRYLGPRRGAAEQETDDQTFDQNAFTHFVCSLSVLAWLLIDGKLVVTWTLT